MPDTLQAHPSEYYTRWPSESQLEAFFDTRRPAIADPLEKGIVLDWSGPTLHPDTLPALDYPLVNTPEPTPNPPRPLLHPLPAPNSPSRGGEEGWSLRLLEPVQASVDYYSQIWRCEVRHPTLSSPCIVVVKLRQQRLFPPPNGHNTNLETEFFNWFPASHLIQREALAYSRLRPYQGCDVPICYGFYSFTLPCGDKVVGVVLEELTDAIIALPTWPDRQRAGNRLTLNAIICLTFAAFLLQNRVLNSGLDKATFRPDQLALFKSSLPVEFRLINIGFGQCTSRERADELVQKAVTEVAAEGGDPHPDLVQPPGAQPAHPRLRARRRGGQGGPPLPRLGWRKTESGY